MSTMSPEEQRIAIAEACGWKWTYEVEDGIWHHTRLTAPDGSIMIQSGFGKAPTQREIKEALKEWPVHHLPRYLSDLNAMHEAEKTLEERGLYNRYEITLGRVLQKLALTAFPFSTVSATAPQRAEAFLRTIGKWNTEALRLAGEEV